MEIFRLQKYLRKEKKRWSRDFSDYESDPERVRKAVQKDIDDGDDFYTNNLKWKYSAYRNTYENFIDVRELCNSVNGATKIKIPYIWQQIQTLVPNERGS